MSLKSFCAEVLYMSSTHILLAKPHLLVKPDMSRMEVDVPLMQGHCKPPGRGEDVQCSYGIGGRAWISK